jgi:hypothetical protein
MDDQGQRYFADPRRRRDKAGDKPALPQWTAGGGKDFFTRPTTCGRGCIRGQSRCGCGRLRVTALRIAREAIKLRLRREGHIVSQYKASAITQMAKELFEKDRERLLAEAQAQIAKRPVPKARIRRGPSRTCDWTVVGFVLRSPKPCPS